MSWSFSHVYQLNIFQLHNPDGFDCCPWGDLHGLMLLPLCVGGYVRAWPITTKKVHFKNVHYKVYRMIWGFKVVLSKLSKRQCFV